MLLTVGAGVAVLLAGYLWLAVGPEPGIEENDPPVVALSLVESQGKAVYESNCASCHGSDGEGQPNWVDANADDTFPAPPHDGDGHTWHHADGHLYRVVLDGEQDSPGFKASMPHYRDVLSPDEIRAVLTYIKTFWGPRERELQAQSSAVDPFP